MALATIACASCGGGAREDGAIIVTVEVPATYGAALLLGELIVADGCYYIKLDDGTTSTIVWPPGTEFTDDAVVTVKGKRLQHGTAVVLGGGLVSFGSAASYSDSQRLRRCAPGATTSSVALVSP